MSNGPFSPQARAALLVVLFLLPLTSFAQSDAQRSASGLPSLRALMAEGQYGAALVEADRYQASHRTGRTQALLLGGEAALRLERFDTAERMLRQLLETTADDEFVRELSVRPLARFVAQEQWPSARAWLSRLTDLPLSTELQGEAAYWEAYLLEREGDLDAAADRYAIAADRSDQLAPHALLARAYLLARTERLAESRRALQRLRAAYPESPLATEAPLLEARLEYGRGDYVSAARVVQSADSSAGAAPIARFILAEALNQVGEREAAAETYDALLEDAPASWQRPVRLGAARNAFVRTDYEEAARLFASVADARTDSLARYASYMQALAYQHLDRREGADSLYQHVTTRWPEADLGEQAAFERARMWSRGEAPRRAEEALSAFLTRYPASAEAPLALRLRASAREALGDLDGAQADLRELRGSGGAVDGETLFRTGYVALQSGEYADAFAALERYLQQFPAGDYVADALFWGAESAFQTDRYAQTEELLARYLRQYPDGAYAAQADYVKAWSHFKEAEYDAAARHFESFLARYEGRSTVPYRSDALLRLGDSHFARREYDRARAAYARVTGEGTPYALYQMAQAAYLSGTPAPALSSLRQLVTQYPGSTWAEEARFQIGYILTQQQQYAEAVEAYEALLDTDPGADLAARTRYAIGDALFNAGRHDEALGAYVQTLRTYPDRPVARDAAESAQYALLALGTPERSDSLVSTLRDQGDDRAAALLEFNRGVAAYESGMQDEALQQFQQFVRTTDEGDLLSEAYAFLGTLYADAGQSAEAMNYLRRVAEQATSPEQQRAALARLGRLYLENDRPADALAAFEEVTDLAEEDAVLADARYGEAEALIAMGRLDAARERLEDALGQIEDERTALPLRLGLGRIYLQEGDQQRAAELFRSVASNARGNIGAEALYHLARTQIQQGEREAAVETLSRIDALFPGASEWRARGLLLQAQLLQELGRPGAARPLYDRIVQEFQGTAFADSARTARSAL